MKVVFIGASRIGLRCLDTVRQLPGIDIVGIITNDQRFSISYAPDESWFRGQAEDFVRDRLLSKGTALHDYLNVDYINSALNTRSKGEANKRLLIWSLLSLATWLEQFKS